MEFLNITPQPSVTFEELDEALKPLKGAEPTAYAIALIYGSVCAPHSVRPSEYLPMILGEKMILPDPQTAERVLSLLYSLNNQLAEVIEDDLPLTVRRRSYSVDKAGLLLQAADLLHEVEGFQEGLYSGVESKSDLSKACAEHVAQLVLEQRYLESIRRSIQSKKKPSTEDDMKQRQQELDIRSASIARAMQSIAHILYVRRMKAYKAQGVLRIGRNDPCPCGSGKKFKNCCMDKIRQSNPENN
jgi:uncharacterized protein YecA (UPF0149 family)